jgi:hypothetical protein
MKSIILFHFLISVISAELSLIFERLREQEKRLSEAQLSLTSLRKMSPTSTLQNAPSLRETETSTNV